MIVFSVAPDNFRTFFRHFFDIFRTFFGHSLFLGCPTICPSQIYPLVSRPVLCSWSLKAGHNKAGRSDFRNQRFEPETAKMRKMRTVPLTPEKQKGLRRFHREKKQKTRKMRTQKSETPEPLRNTANGIFQRKNLWIFHPGG